MKFAVLTQSAHFLEHLCDCFSRISIECVQFSSDIDLTRSLYREDFHAILVDAKISFDSMRMISARRACYGEDHAPLLIVGAFPDSDSFDRAFKSGADDIIVAPFTDNELSARTRNALQRMQRKPEPKNSDCITHGSYVLDRQISMVWIAGRAVRVTTLEFSIAWLLFSQAGEYATRRHLASAIWGSSEDVVARRLEQHIHKLRRKLQLTGEFGVVLRTMYAHGYRIELTDKPHGIETELAYSRKRRPEMSGTRSVECGALPPSQPVGTK